MMIVKSGHDLSFGKNQTYDDSKTSTWSWIGHFLFFGAFFFLNNPFFEIETAFRFSTFILLVIVGAAFIIGSRATVQFSRVPLVAIIFIIFSITIARQNEVGSVGSLDSTEQAIQSVISMIVLMASVLISDAFRIAVARHVMLIFSLLCSLWICLNYELLFEANLIDKFVLGTLNSDSYQTVTQILGMFVILAVSHIREYIKWNFFSIVFSTVLAILSMFCIFVIFQGYARGEAVALIVSLALYFLGSYFAVATVLILFFSATYLINIIDSPLTQRLSSIVQGDFGERDILLSQSFSAIGSDGFMLLFGRGMNYFQSLYNYPFEMYPHNIFVESIISGGAILFALLFWIYFRPIAGFIRKKGSSLEMKFVFSIAIFDLLIYLKSGTIVSFWGLGFLTCMYLALADSEKARVPAQ